MELDFYNLEDFLDEEDLGRENDDLDSLNLVAALEDKIIMAPFTRTFTGEQLV